MIKTPKEEKKSVSFPKIEAVKKEEPKEAIEIVVSSPKFGDKEG